MSLTSLSTNTTCFVVASTEARVYHSSPNHGEVGAFICVMVIKLHVFSLKFFQDFGLSKLDALELVQC